MADYEELQGVRKWVADRLKLNPAQASIASLVKCKGRHSDLYVQPKSDREAWDKTWLTRDPKRLTKRVTET